MRAQGGFGNSEIGLGKGGTRARAHVRRRCVSAIVAGLFLVLLVSGVEAATLVSATVGATTNSSPSGPESASEPTAFGNHVASASFGVLNASSGVSFAGLGSDDGLLPRASFTDDFTITAPGATTVPGTMTVLVRIDGGPQYEQSASSGAVAQGINTGYQVFTIRAGGFGNLFDGTINYNSGMIPPEAIINTVPAPGLVPVEFTFSFGFPVELGFEVLARSAGNNSFSPPDMGSLSGATDVTLVWEGITSIRDGNGNELLAQATVASASGIDWRASQGPQPAVPLGPWVAPVVGLLLAATGAWAIRSRRVS